MIQGLAKSEEQEFYCTLEEWAEYEDPDGERFEFIDGKLVQLPENTWKHGRIISNTNAAVHQALKKKNSKCRMTEGSQKIYFPDYGHGGYPDLAIVCGKPEFWQQKEWLLTNPILVVEVLSKSTHDYDRGSKFSKYRSLPSFKEYVLISQYEPKIETWFKMEENVWRISRFEGLDAKLKIYSLGIEIALSDIYFQLEEEPEPTEN